MLSFAFFLGIVFITFNMLWGIFTFILRMFVEDIGQTEKYILRLTQAYFLASMTSMATLDFGQSHELGSVMLVSTGVIVLFLYLISKIEQRKNMIQFNLQFNKNEIKFNQNSLKYDVLIAVLTVAFYVGAIFYKPLVVNVANDWFFETIKSIYATPIIGWIIGFIGVFFIVSIFIKGIVSFQIIYGQITGFLRGDKPKSDEDFIDYEVVEEEHKYIDEPED